MNFQQNKKNGFAALITALVISLILIIVTVTLNRSGFFTRSAILEAEYKEMSLALAEACVDIAILRLATDSSYSLLVADDEPVSSETCTIVTVLNNTPVGYHTIQTSAETRESVTKLEIVLNVSGLAVVSWKEI